MVHLCFESFLHGFEGKACVVYLTVSNVGNAITGNKSRINSGFERCGTAPALVAISGSLIKHWECFPEASFPLAESTIRVHAVGSKNQVPQLGMRNTKKDIEAVSLVETERTKRSKKIREAHILSKNPPEKAANLSMPSF